MDKPDIEKVKLANVSQMKFRDAQAKRTELLALGKEFYDGKGDEAATPDEISYISTINQGVEELEHHIKEQGDYEAMRVRQVEAYGKTQAGAPNYEDKGQQPERKENPLASIILDNPEFKKWFDAKTGNGSRPISDNDSVNNSPEIPFSKKDLVTDAALTTGALVRPDYKPLVELGWPKLVLRDLMSVGTTQSSEVIYPRINLRPLPPAAGTAQVVPEATATGGSSGTKPEAKWGIEPVTANVQTVAHWIPVTKTALSDAGQLELLLNNFLLNGLDQTVENELLNGAGGSGHLLGLTNQVGILGQDFVTTGADAGDNMILTSRRAKTRVENLGHRAPNGYLFNPNDWDTIETTKASGSGIYYFGGPAVIGPPRLWGLPVVTSFYQPQGSGYCADFKQYALWDREQSGIKMTDGYMDFFIRNMVVILAELRLANGVLDANGICQMDLFAGKNS